MITLFRFNLFFNLKLVTLQKVTNFAGVAVCLGKIKSCKYI